MSYNCQISFKKIAPEEVFAFQKKLKVFLVAYWKDIAKENFVFCPFIRNASGLPDKLPDIKDRVWQESECWVEKLFHFRFFYDADNQLLGVYSLPSVGTKLFDKTIIFQNSCDQDYERSEYEGIDLFEKIFDKWTSYDEERFRKEYKAVFSWDFNDEDFGEYKTEEEKLANWEYEKRSAAYREIWSLYENTLYNDDSAIYLSLISSQDMHFKRRFLYYIFNNCGGKSR